MAIFFFSTNDVPFMAVMTWALLAIIAMARGGIPSWRATLTAGACCGLAIATRIGGILAQVYLVAAMSLLCMADSSSEGNTRAVSSMFRVGRFVQQGVENLVGRCVVVALARP